MNHDLIVITSRGQIGQAIDCCVPINTQSCTGLTCNGSGLTLTSLSGFTIIAQSIKLHDREERNNANI